MPTHAHSARPAERWVLVALLAFTAVAVAGYWNFALHPERLPPTPLARQFFAISFQFFGRVPIVLSALALAVVLVGRLRLRWIPAMVAAYGVAFLAEHVGTGYGLPFGAYGYTELLGFKLGDRVPALIPLSWFLMGLPAWIVARAAYPESPLRRITVAALLLVAWDLALDPAMSFLTPYWLWQDSGPYYGMPWINLLGWFVTGAVIMAVFERLAPALRLGGLPVRWMGAYYLVVLLMPMGMLAAAGHWLAVAVTAAAVASCGWMVRGAWRAGAPGETGERPAGVSAEAPVGTSDAAAEGGP
ncbi:MAG: carotenoid biosynthesis protein, partial [Gemmatimonadetes bacterium]|nr:carotenoid biosynthesis protein [Gemmatimonadota bacterium]